MVKATLEGGYRTTTITTTVGWRALPRLVTPGVHSMRTCGINLWQIEILPQHTAAAKRYLISLVSRQIRSAVRVRMSWDGNETWLGEVGTGSV